MLATIQNDCLRVQVSTKGAELSSIQDLLGREYLWQGDAKIWPRKAPLLFPVIARLKDQSYRLGDRTYSIGSHGFCRDAEFTLETLSSTQLSFTLEDSPETLALYPYRFRLSLFYTLEGNQIQKTFRVENRSDTPMYYELGGHDGYRVALRSGEKMGDYAIRLPGLERITPYGMDGENMITPKGKSYPLPQGRMPLKPSAYLLDTIILDDLPQREAHLVDGDDQLRLKVEFPDFPYLGVWTADRAYDTNYVCIEPWTSLPDATFVGRDLSEKAGIRCLASGAQEELGYRMTVYPL